MAGAAKQGDLFPGQGAPAGTVVVNDRCVLKTQDEHRVVVVSGVVLAQYGLGDAMAEAYAMVSLVEQGWADQNDVARAFGCTSRTVRRHRRRFEEGGLAGLGRRGGFPTGRSRVRSSRLRLVSRLKADGVPHREIARRLGVTPKAVRKLLRRLGWVERKPVQESLPLGGKDEDPKELGARKLVPVRARSSLPSDGDPNLSPSSTLSSEDLSFSFDANPAERSVDRLLACLGLLADATPLFRSGVRVPRGGVLLAIPALLESSVFDIARSIYGSIGPAFYGLRTTLVTVLLMALLRIKRPEALKEHSPEDLGRLLGLDRAPEVKTLRRKLTRLASFGRGAAFGRALAERRVEVRGSALGFLYVDGHVRVYHGKHSLPKAHVARMRLALPATSDYWVNDAAGDPLFVITAEANAGMVKMLPIVLAEVRNLVGERRVTIVFDRGGWSPKLFAKLIADGFDILTYRKGRLRRIPVRSFRLRRSVIDARRVRYLLDDRRVRLLGGKLRLRQVTRLTKQTGHQTPIITSRMDLSAVQVAFRMFDRWRQENFFKYLREEYALDTLVDYQVEPDNPARDVPNPTRKALDEDLREARAELNRLRTKYGEAAFANPEAVRHTMRGFKHAHSKLGSELGAAMKRLAALEAKRARVPKRVPVQHVVKGKVVKLATERKHLTNLFKMVAYQAESDLARLVAPHYKRAEAEGRTLLQSALNGAASLDVCDEELRVTLAPLSSAHRTRAIGALCEKLNRTAAAFPGTKLRLRYAVEAGA